MISIMKEDVIQSGAELAEPVWHRDEQFQKNGGFGEISLFTNKITGEMLAVKTVKKDKQITEKILAGWQRECDMMLSLDHANIVQAKPLSDEIKHIINTDLPLLAMEFCSDGDLRNFLRKPENCHGLSQCDVQCVMHDVAAAIEYLHQKEIVHRDIKPENILLFHSEPSRIIYKLSDLGFAKDLSESSTCDTALGTIFYLAPEIQCKQSYGFKADYWSFGTVVFECIVGKRPFFHSNDLETWRTLDIIKLKEKKRTHIHGYIDKNDHCAKFSENIPQPNRMHKSLLSYIEQWLRLMLEWDPTIRGGRHDNKARPVCFALLDQILSVQFVNFFCVSSNEMLSYPLHDNSSTLSPSTQLNYFISLIEKEKHIPVQHIELLNSEGQLVDPQNQAALHAASFRKPTVSQIYLFDTRNLPTNFQQVQMLPNLQQHMMFPVEPGSYMELISWFVYDVFESFIYIEKLIESQESSRMCLVRGSALSSSRVKELDTMCKYFNTQHSFYTESLRIDEDELCTNRQVVKFTKDQWSLPADYTSHCNNIHSENCALQNALVAMETNMIQLQHSIDLTATKQSELYNIKSVVLNMYEHVQKSIKDAISNKLTALPEDRQYVSTVQLVARKWQQCEKELLSLLNYNLREILKYRQEASHYSKICDHLRLQLHRASQMLKEFQKKRQTDIWKLLAHQIIEMQTKNQNPQPKEVEDKTSTQPIAETLVQQSLQTKAELEELMQSLVINGSTTRNSCLDWSFLDIDNTFNT